MHLEELKQGQCSILSLPVSLPAPLPALPGAGKEGIDSRKSVSARDQQSSNQTALG